MPLRHGASPGGPESCAPQYLGCSARDLHATERPRPAQLSSRKRGCRRLSRQTSTCDTIRAKRRVGEAHLGTVMTREHLRQLSRYQPAAPLPVCRSLPDSGAEVSSPCPLVLCSEEDPLLGLPLATCPPRLNRPRASTPNACQHHSQGPLVHILGHLPQCSDTWETRVQSSHSLGSKKKGNNFADLSYLTQVSKRSFQHLSYKREHGFCLPPLRPVCFLCPQHVSGHRGWEVAATLALAEEGPVPLGRKRLGSGPIPGMGSCLVCPL